MSAVPAAEIGLPGIRYARREDHRLITGTGAFTDDLRPDQMLHGHVIRSPHARAKIVRIDLSAVRAAPGVRWIMTADDVTQQGGGSLPNSFTFPGRGGTTQQVATMPVLARDQVLFVGQPVVMVIAESAAQAQDAADLADIEYEELDAAVTPEQALASGAPQLHANVPGNVSLHFESGDEKAVTDAFARAPLTSRHRVQSQRLVGFPMEPRAVIATHDSASGRTRLFTPSQGVTGMLKSVSQASGIPTEQIEVLTYDVGGSFGLRSNPYSEHVLVMLAARHLGCPVGWTGTRSEIFVSDYHGRALTLEGSIALDRDGQILALRFDDTIDLGAFSVGPSSLIGARNLSVTMGGSYRIPALYMNSKLVYTNAVPMAAYRGAGRPDIAFAIETLLDHAAHEHGFDPVELRRRNFIPPEAFPYKTANGTLYDLCEFHRTLDRALDLSDWAGFKARREAAAQRGKLRGIGLACYLEASGAGAVPADTVQGDFDEQGQLTIYGVTGASGQGHETSFATIVEQELGLPAERVRYAAGHHGRALMGNGTGGSRTLYGAGSAIVELCARIREQAQALWLELGGAPDGAPELATWIPKLDSSQRARLAAEGKAQSGSTFPNGTHVAEIEIDPATGITDVVRYIAVDDLGRVISPQLVIGQLQGGVVQGWGQVFCEHAIYDDRGQLSTGSLMDYALPKAGCIPAVEAEQIAARTDLNRVGAKGVGEAGCTGSIPALTNAMMNALRRHGIDAMDTPFTPARVWEALHPAA
ncbi:MAG: xanthine dehydrogenase family protein molybdopterin-binding subunit [Betaproteobacteria bacterium]